MPITDFTRGTLGSGTPFIGFTSPYQLTAEQAGMDVSGLSPAAPAPRQTFQRPAFSGQTSGGGSNAFGIAQLREAGALERLNISEAGAFKRATIAGARPPGSFQVGTKTEEFGRNDYAASLMDWNRVYTDVQKGIPAALDLMDRFAPGGPTERAGFARSDQQFKDIVAGGTATQVASGLSQKIGFLGIAAMEERGIREDEIRSQVARDAIGATSVYGQMLANLRGVGADRPIATQFIDRRTTPVLKTFEGIDQQGRRIPA